MSTNIDNSVLTNNDSKELDGSTLKSVESEPLKKFKNEFSLNKINISADNTRPYKIGNFESKGDWFVSKKDSERTIIDDNYHVLKTNKDSSSSLSLIDKVSESVSFKEGIFDNITFEKPGQLSHSETLINDETFETIPIDRHVPITHSETLVNEDTIRTTTTAKSDPVTVTHSETLVNEVNYRNFLTEHTDHSIDSLQSLYDFSPVDEIISDNSMLIDSLEHFEIDPKENYSFENDNFQVDDFDDNLVTFSEESLTYDDIFNYNSNIILSDDEDVRREKIEELYNEAIIMSNLDNNAFAFVNEDSYNEYFDNSLDNSGSTDYSLFERDPNISYKRSSVSKSLDLSHPSNQEYSNDRYIDKDAKLFENLPIDTVYPDTIRESSEFEVISPVNDNKYVSADDDAIYVIDDGYVEDDDELQQEQKNKKKVTFNENVRVKRIDSVNIKENSTFKYYFKNSFRKLKKLFTNDHKKNIDEDIYDYQEELPIITIEYVDDYYDIYNKKEVLFFGDDYPRIVIDFTDEFCYEMGGYDEQYYNYQNMDQDDLQMYQNDNEKVNNHHGEIEGENADHVKIMNDDTKATKFVSEVEETVNIVDNKSEEVPFYLREDTVQKKKEKKKLAKKLIDKVINMEKNFNREQEKLSSKNERDIKSLKEPELAREQESSKELENKKLIVSNESVQTSSTDILEATPESVKSPKDKPVLKKKSKSVNYIKNVYKSLKYSLSLNDTSKDQSGEEIEDDKEENNISNKCIFETNINNDNVIDNERNKDQTEFHLFENSETSVDNEIKKVKKEIDINKIIDNRLEKVQSSLTTVVGEEDKMDFEKVEVILNNDRTGDEGILKNKKSKSFFSLFKKSHSKNSITDVDDKDNDNNLVKSNKTNSQSFFTHIKNNFNFKSKTTSEQNEQEEQEQEQEQEQENVFTASIDKDEGSFQQEIENDQPISLEKIDSSLTETDILAKQISNLSSSFDNVTNHSSADNTQLSDQIVESSWIDEMDYIYSLYTDSINQQEDEEQNHQFTSNEIEKESSLTIDYENHQSIGNSIENNDNDQHISNQKTFNPVVLPIDNENDFSRVDTIEIIDEYIFDSPKPILYYTNDGKEEEISEIIIEDRFLK